MATLKELRKLCKVSRKALSEMTGINPRIIQRYEDGDSKIENMTIATARRLSAVIGCDIADLENVDLSVLNLAKIDEAIKEGEVDMSDVVGMAKLSAVKKKSEIGTFPEMFSRNLEWVLENVVEKLTIEELSDLVGAVYRAYSQGKREGRRELQQEIEA